jgi:hypothetical protein
MLKGGKSCHPLGLVTSHWLGFAVAGKDDDQRLISLKKGSLHKMSLLSVKERLMRTFLVGQVPTSHERVHVEVFP